MKSPDWQTGPRPPKSAAWPHNNDQWMWNVAQCTFQRSSLPSSSEQARVTPRQHRWVSPLQVQSWPRRAGNSRLFSFPFFKNHTTRFLRSDLTYPAVRRNKPKSLSGQKRQPTWLTVAPVGTRGWWPSALLPPTPLLTVTHLRQMFTPCYLLSKEEKKNQVSRSSLFLTRGSILSHCSPRVPLSF